MLAPAWLATSCVVTGLLFLQGRVLCRDGYVRGVPSRALGFALTFNPTLAWLIGALLFAGRRLGG